MLSVCSFLSLLLRVKEKETKPKKEKNADLIAILRIATDRHSDGNKFCLRQIS